MAPKEAKVRGAASEKAGVSGEDVKDVAARLKKKAAKAAGGKDGGGALGDTSAYLRGAEGDETRKRKGDGEDRDRDGEDGKSERRKKKKRTSDE